MRWALNQFQLDWSCRGWKRLEVQELQDFGNILEGLEDGIKWLVLP